MTAEYPDIYVYQKKKVVNSNRNGKANKLLVIGAFDTLVSDPVLYLDKDECITALGDDTTYNGCKALPQLWKGASSILAVNITTETEGTRDKTLTTAKLSSALAKVKGEDFDIVYVAESITDEAIVIIDTFLNEHERMKLPAGYVAGINRATTSAYLTTAGIAGEHCYGLLTQTLNADGVELDSIESSAYYVSVLCNLPVGNTMTMKQIPAVTGVMPELTFETGDAGRSLLGAGITTIKPVDRGSSKFVVVNSEQPNGLDLYINRVRDYVIKELNLHRFFSERNRPATYNEIIQELDRVKYNCIDSLDLLKDINYTVEKVDSKTVKIDDLKLVFDGIITRINVYYYIEVE